jgi:hypothetical protein
MKTNHGPWQSRRVVMLLMAAAVLLPSLYGFGTKLIEFIALARGDVEGSFAISPVVNYLLASFGFLMLFGWAALGGMFRDIEQPKYAMLENEAKLDRAGAGRPPTQADAVRIRNELLGPAPVAVRNPRFGGPDERR